MYFVLNFKASDFLCDQSYYQMYDIHSSTSDYTWQNYGVQKALWPSEVTVKPWEARINSKKLSHIRQWRKNNISMPHFSVPYRKILLTSPLSTIPRDHG